MKATVFHPDAAKEVDTAADWYESQQSGLGDDFRAEVRAALLRIQHNPQLYAVETGSIRLCLLHRFPYSVFYEEVGDLIWVAAVGHQSRRPGYWSYRRLG